MIKVAVIGASGAIGNEFVTQYANMDNIAEVYAFSRNLINHESPKVKAYKVDYFDENQWLDILPDMPKFDIIILASGILHDEGIMPEKSIKEVSELKMMHILKVNTVLPAIIMKHFLPKLSDSGRFGILSARIGSISDNHLGGWYSYRASKAALNMLIKTASIELKRKKVESIIIGLHPGTVNTKLSKPFHANIPEKQIFTPEFSVNQMVKVILDITPESSGKFFAYDGLEVQP